MSFYTSIEIPDIQQEHKHILKTELLFPQHENWFVGLICMMTNNDNNDTNQQYVNYWISESNVLTKSPNFVLTALDMKGKEYYILVNNKHKIELHHNNYTWSKFVQTLVTNFNDFLRQEKVDIIMEFRTDSTKIIFHNKMSRQKHMIKFSSDLAKFLSLYTEIIVSAAATLSTIMPFVVPPVKMELAESDVAEGTIELPVNPEVQYKFTITTTKQPENTTTSLTCTIPPGLWTFFLLQKYINDFLKETQVKIVFPINYEYSAQGIFLSYFYAGKIQFINTSVNTSDLSYNTIKFDNALVTQMNINPSEMVIQVKSATPVSCDYRILIAKDDPVIQKYSIKQPVSYMSLNAPQQIMSFQKNKIVLLKPVNKHEYTEYKLMLDETLNKLLGINDAAKWLSFDYETKQDCTNVIFETENNCYSVFTDIIVDNEMMPMLENGKYKLLCHVMPSSIIYPTMYFKVNQHRINYISIKCSGVGKAAATAAKMVLHFMRST